MNYNKAKKIRGSITAIPSKSYLIRALLLATLSTEPTKIHGLYMSDDVINTINVIKTMGSDVEISGDTINVCPKKHINNNIHINVGESATLLRLIVPILSVLGINATIDVEGSLKNRDIDKNFDILRENGAEISKGFPITLSGKLNNFDIKISDYSTSGVASGLIIALSFVGGKITLNKSKINKGYIDITKDIATSFSGCVLEQECGYEIKKSTFKCNDYYVEGDYSNASTFLVLGAVFGEIKVQNLNQESLQADRKITDILRQMGATIETRDDGVLVKSGNLKPIEIDVSKNLDIVPALSVVASCARGTSVFKNINNLKIKESNRAEEIVKMLNCFGIFSEILDDNLIICGGDGKVGNYIPPNDHRMVMAGTMMALIFGGSVENVDCIKKSYPTFFDDIEKLEICYE